MSALASEKSRPLVVAQKLLLNGEVLMEGTGTLGVIYNILAGHVIMGPAVYRQFLAYLQDTQECPPIRTGDRVSLLANEACIVGCTIGADKAPVFTQKLQYDVLLGQFEKLEKSIARAVEPPAVEPSPQLKKRRRPGAVSGRVLDSMNAQMLGSPFQRDESNQIVLVAEEADWLEPD